MSLEDEVDSRTRLKSELEKMKRITGLGSELELLWSPDEGSDRHGEVRGGLLRIYDADEDEALMTLRHEFLDHLITKEVIEPLVMQINMQKKLIESMIYDRKERVIDRLVKIVDDSIRR